MISERDRDKELFKQICRDWLRTREAKAEPEEVKPEEQIREEREAVKP